MGLFSIFGIGNTVKKALQNGAVIIDVRTPNEYDRGRIPGSINIPVDRIAASLERIQQFTKPIIFCCSTGERSRQAVTIVAKSGIKEVINGGNWEKLLKTISAI